MRYILAFCLFIAAVSGCASIAPSPAHKSVQDEPIPEPALTLIAKLATYNILLIPAKPITATWSPPTTGSPPVLYYLHWVTNHTTVTTDTTATIMVPTHADSVSARVYAEDELGRAGAWSEWGDKYPLEH
jgi:hypothetical protein